MSTDALLALHAAAAPFLGAGRQSRRQLTLSAAIVRVCRERGAAPPALILTPDDALKELAAVLRRCEAARVPWDRVVALVNREYGNGEPS